ncbi:MAG: hypothetical protein ABSC05_09295 [Candidatus Solibacter sp.]
MTEEEILEEHPGLEKRRSCSNRHRQC